MERITRKNLERLCGMINREAGTPEATWTKRGDGQLVANIGNYCIDGAYGGWELQQIANDMGGVRDISKGGHVTKRELYDTMHAYLNGMRAGKELQRGAVS